VLPRSALTRDATPGIAHLPARRFLTLLCNARSAPQRVHDQGREQFSLDRQGRRTLVVMEPEKHFDEETPRRDLVVIGASAGGLGVLKQLVSELPAAFGAAICVVLHISAESPSALGPILHRAGTLPCHAAQDGEELRPGCILVAPPDRHLIVEAGRVRLTLDPRENGHRPAVDALFRSAAAVGGEHVVGVILSGAQNDGAVGLAAIKAGGGAAVVQDPEEALYTGMPTSALEHVAADAVVRTDALASTLTAIVNGTHPTTPTRVLAEAAETSLRMVKDGEEKVA